MKFYVDDWDKERVQFNWGKTSSIVNTMNVVLDIWVNDGIFDPILGIKVTNATMLVIKPYSGRQDDQFFSECRSIYIFNALQIKCENPIFHFLECIDNKLSCVVGGKYVCLEYNPRCDGKEDCDDKIDERDCQGKFAKPTYKLVISGS